MIYFQLFLITFIVVNIVDVSDLSNSIEKYLRRWFKKPVEFKLCSYCINWWTGLLYLIINSELSLLNIAFVLLLSFCTDIIKELQFVLKDLILIILKKLFIW